MASADLTPLIAGNWKMNGRASVQTELERSPRCGHPIGPGRPLPPRHAHPALCTATQGSPLAFGRPGLSCQPAGAFTGDISAEMLAMPVRAFIVGHSERRTLHNETDGLVHRKVEARYDPSTSSAASSPPRSPTGPTAGNLVMAYEPVWAIGSGLTPTPADVAEVHGFIRERLVGRHGAASEGNPHPLWRLGQAGQRRGAS